MSEYDPPQLTPTQEDEHGLMERIKQGDYLKFTLGLLVWGAILIIIYDVLPAISEKLGDTISEQTALWSLFLIIIPAGMGTLMGHLFGPQWFRTNGWVTLALIPYALALAWCGWRGLLQPLTHNMVCLVFCSHFVLGCFTWSQGDMRERLAIQYQQLVERFDTTQEVLDGHHD